MSVGQEAGVCVPSAAARRPRELEARLRDLEKRARVIARGLSITRHPHPTVRESVDDAIQHVLFAMWRRTRVGPSIHDEEAFLRRAISNYLVSVARKLASSERIEDDRDMPTSVMSPVVECEEVAVGLDERRAEVRREVTWAAEAAIARRKTRYRADADLAWREIQSLSFEGASLDRLFLQESKRRGDDPADSAALARARLAVYQRHSRFRREMQAAIDAGERDGRLASRVAERKMRCMQFLFRARIAPPREGALGASSVAARE